LQKDYNEQTSPKINYWDEAGHVISVDLPKGQIEKFIDTSFQSSENKARKFTLLDLPREDKNGIKETDGKLDYSEINFKLLDLMAKRFMDNKVKYPKGNTKKVIDKGFRFEYNFMADALDNLLSDP